MKRNTPAKGVTKKSSNKISQAYICQLTKESFDLSIKHNLLVFQNQTKAAKIKVVFYCFPSLGLNKPP